MSTLSELWRKQRTRWHGRGIDRRHQLRRRLAYYVARHGFEVGDYSIGAPIVRFWNTSTRLTIGKYCSIAEGVELIIDGNHRTNYVTTYPLAQSFGFEPKSDAIPYSRGDMVIGSDVWIAANATILSGVKIGDGAAVGAGSVVVQDIPPYAVVFGNPARIVSKRFSEHIITQLLELQWWDLPYEKILKLGPLLQSENIESFIGACRKIRGAQIRKTMMPVYASETNATSAAIRIPLANASDTANRRLIAWIQGELPAFSGSDLNIPFEQIGMDSFGMLSLRTRIEESIGAAIDDEVWTSIVTPADVARIVSSIEVHNRDIKTDGGVNERRSYNLNMPQMALSGLSESWLFKEIGDIHWSMITQGLKVPSSELKDGNGHRLYATFSRFQLDSTAPLANYRENEAIGIDAGILRHGAGMFFSEASVRGQGGKSARAKLMSTFSRYGEAGSNTSLLKGQPELPADCDIPALPELPPFAQDYRAQRARALADVIFECDYEIIPSHDINGVGLLYFAAYPIINDICVMNYAGRSIATSFSTRYRDVFYFANCDPEEKLRYCIHLWRAGEAHIEIEASLRRKSDGVLMAYIATKKDKVRR